METAVLVMLFLMVKHFVADFLYQPPYQWMNKGTYGHLGGIFHSGQHVLLTALLYFMVDMSASTLALILVVEFLVHYHMDWFKMWFNKRQGWGANTHAEFWYLMGFDQLVHGLTYVWILWILI